MRSIKNRLGTIFPLKVGPIVIVRRSEYVSPAEAFTLGRASVQIRYGMPPDELPKVRHLHSI